MTKNKLISLTLPMFFLAFSVWVFVSGQRMGENLGAFPRLIGIFTFGVAVFHLADVLRRKDHEDRFAQSNLLKVAELLAVLCIYVFLLKKAGYFICTSVLMFYMMLTQGYKRYAVAALTSVLFTALVFFVFKVLLNVPLPTLFP